MEMLSFTIWRKTESRPEYIYQRSSNTRLRGFCPFSTSSLWTVTSVKMGGGFLLYFLYL